MKLLVFSDTHGDSQRLLEVLRREKSADALIFLGDGATEADLLEDLHPRTPVYRVRGNCDYASYDPEDGLVVFDGMLFYYTHGHTSGVKYGLGQLWQQAHARGAKAALYGHSHIPHYEYREGIHLFNPGSLTIPRFGGGPTYGRITVQDGTAFFEVRPY